MSDKSAQLRSLLQSPELEFIMEAHNGISARIVEETGFKGIWASGLAISAQFGVRDSNEASWTQVVDMLEFMSDVTSIPILLDGDTGYGNFNNMRRLVRKLEQRNIAGVCIEDKQFPKLNSFINGERQPLAQIDEFSGKIKAGKDSQMNDDFCIVARIEALIAGWGMAEAIKRAEAYHAAGADAILIHSKLSTADEILEFAHEWANRLPLVIVPTTYYSTDVEVFRKANVGLVIWANHMIRASVAAMESIAAEIHNSESLLDVEHKVSPVKHIFSLQGTDELTRAQERYLSPEHAETQAVVLAASRGTALRDLTEDRPKVMLPVAGKPLLRHLLDEFKQQNINTTHVVAGYKAETINIAGVSILENKDYESTGELKSLVCAEEHFTSDMIITYGDLLFRSYILRDLMEIKKELVVVIDSVDSGDRISGSPDYAWCSRDDDRSLFSENVLLEHISQDKHSKQKNSSGRWIGLIKVSGDGINWLKSALQALKQQENFDQLGMPDLLNYLIKDQKPVYVQYINGHWLDINNLNDLDIAGDFTH